MFFAQINEEILWSWSKKFRRKPCFKGVGRIVGFLLERILSLEVELTPRLRDAAETQ